MSEKQQKKPIGEWVLFILGVILLICGVILSFQDKTTSATATYGAGILCLIFSSLSLFQSFKGLGIEAVLKEKIEEADELIEQLRSFSLPTAKLLLSNVARLGRYGSIHSRKDKYDLCNEISKSMLALGIPALDIDEAKKDIHRFNLFDMARPIFKDFDQLVNSESQKLQEQMDALPQPIEAENRDKLGKLIHSKNEIESWKKKFHNLHQQEDLLSLGEEIEDYIQNCSFVDASEKENFLSKHHETIVDLKYYGNNKEFRRLDVWFSGDK